MQDVSFRATRFIAWMSRLGRERLFADVKNWRSGCRCCQCRLALAQRSSRQTVPNGCSGRAAAARRARQALGTLCCSNCSSRICRIWDGLKSALTLQTGTRLPRILVPLEHRRPASSGAFSFRCRGPAHGLREDDASPSSPRAAWGQRNLPARKHSGPGRRQSRAGPRGRCGVASGSRVSRAVLFEQGQTRARSETALPRSTMGHGVECVLPA